MKNKTPQAKNPLFNLFAHRKNATYTPVSLIKTNVLRETPSPTFPKSAFHSRRNSFADSNESSHLVIKHLRNKKTAIVSVSRPKKKGLGNHLRRSSFAVSRKNIKKEIEKTHRQIKSIDSTLKKLS